MSAQSRTSSLAIGLAAAALVGGRLTAQSADGTEERSVSAGAEFRRVRIGEASSAVTIRQFVIPIGAFVPAGRFSFDIGTAYASTELSSATANRTLSHLVDTQIGGSYRFGRDFVVASVVLNLPTGLSRAPAADFPVQGAISSSFLAFPINSYGNGFSATGGLAAAVPAGAWNVGIAGSLRVSSRYTPYIDATGPLTYKPGIEGRVRAGVDRIVGQSRLTAGFTWSTFGTDQLALGSNVAGVYQPGVRWLAEALAVVPAGTGRLSLSAWRYQRGVGDSIGTVVPNRERLSSVGVTWQQSLSPRASLSLGADGRLWNQDDSDGILGGAEIGLGIGLGPRFTLVPRGRFEVGQLKPTGGDLPVRGLSGSVLLRSTF